MNPTGTFVRSLYLPVTKLFDTGRLSRVPVPSYLLILVVPMVTRLSSELVSSTLPPTGTLAVTSEGNSMVTSEASEFSDKMGKVVFKYILESMSPISLVLKTCLTVFPK